MEFLSGFLGALGGGGIVGYILNLIIKRNLNEQKSQLDYMRNIALQLNKSQFESYGIIWSKLVELENIGDKLWKEATERNLNDFLTILSDTELMIRKYSIIIEKRHHEKIVNLIHECWNYKAGKSTLVELYKRGGNIDHHDVKLVISQNGKHIENYKNILNEISEDFRAQLRLDTSST